MPVEDGIVYLVFSIYFLVYCSLIKVSYVLILFIEVYDFYFLVLWSDSTFYLVTLIFLFSSANFFYYMELEDLSILIDSFVVSPSDSSRVIFLMGVDTLREGLIDSHISHISSKIMFLKVQLWHSQKSISILSAASSSSGC